jgi:hypothetical protein
MVLSVTRARTIALVLPAERFPLIAVHADQLVAGDAVERFRFAIDVVIERVRAKSAGDGR